MRICPAGIGFGEWRGPRRPGLWDYSIAHMIDGKMQDDATWKQCKVMVKLAEMLAAKDPELAEAYGL